MLQLIESTAVAVPGLVRASEPVKQNAEMTFTAIQRTPQNPALIYRFMNQVKAYLALADSIPRPYPFPPTADQQYAELRENLQRMQQHFEAILQVQNLEHRQRESDPNDFKHYAEADSKLLPPAKFPASSFWAIPSRKTGAQRILRRSRFHQSRHRQPDHSPDAARFLQDVVALHPKVVVILAGSGDIADGLAPNQIEDNLAMLGDLARAYGFKAAFASILPVSDYHKDADPRNEVTKTRPLATIQALNRWLQNHCQSEGLVYIDYYSAMVDQSGQMQSDLSDDGLHPNAKVIASCRPSPSKPSEELPPELIRNHRTSKKNASAFSAISLSGRHSCLQPPFRRLCSAVSSSRIQTNAEVIQKSY